MSHPLYNVRGGRPEDANVLLDIDIKCFEVAWSPEEWSRIGHSQDYAIAVATYFGTPIGFVILRVVDGEVEIVKIAVKQARRRQGISHLLLASAVEFAQRNRIPTIFVVVPESTIYEDSPYNTGRWATAVGFAPTAPLIKRCFTAYGEVEDGVKFIAPTYALRRNK